MVDLIIELCAAYNSNDYWQGIYLMKQCKKLSDVAVIPGKYSNIFVFIRNDRKAAYRVYVDCGVWVSERVF